MHLTDQPETWAGDQADAMASINQISSQLAVLATFNSQEQGLHASQALTNALDRSTEMRTRYADHNGVLADGDGGSRQSGAPPAGLEQMRSGVAEMHSSNERSFAQIAEIIACGARLREDLSATRQGFAVGTLFAAAVTRARGMLQEIGERNPSALPLDGSPSPNLGLHDFTTNYTMQSEFDVHDEHQGFTTAAPAGQPDALSTEAGELGENVEFF
jgi:hypothetical protein